MPRRSTVVHFLIGLGTYLKVPGVLFRYGLWPYQLLPAVISLILTLVLALAFHLSTAGFAAWVDGLIAIPLAWLDTTLTVTITALVILVLVAGFLLVQKHVILIILAPFLGKIAEETLKAIKGDDYTASELTTMESIARSTRINLRYILREILINLVFLACGVIPVVGSLLSATGVFVTQARFLGYGLMDFPLENRNISVEDSDRFVKKRNGLSIGIGAGYLLLMAIPFIGWMFAPTFGTVAGTLRMIEELESEEKV